jgi:hypothetical protein
VSYTTVRTLQNLPLSLVQKRNKSAFRNPLYVWKDNFLDLESPYSACTVAFYYLIIPYQKTMADYSRSHLARVGGGNTFRTTFLHLAHLDIIWTLFCPAACFTVSCVTWLVVRYRWKYLCDCAAHSSTWGVFNHNYGNKMEILGLGYEYISMIPATHQKVKQGA